jgi:hypothetical protein
MAKLLLVTAHAQLTFTTNNNAITITGYNGAGGTVNIPRAINGYPVTRIDSCEFSSSSGVSNVIISELVTNIAYGAFELYAYPYAPPPDVCLSAITVDTNNPVYCDVDGVLLDKRAGTLMQYPCGKGGSQYTIPNWVANIGTNAFFYCTNLCDVIIPDNVTNLCAQAFEMCFGLTNATIGNGVLSIGANAFYGTSLTSVALGSNVVTIGDNAFSGTGLGNIIIPASVGYLGLTVFQYCPHLAGVYFEGNAPALDSSVNLFYGDGDVTVYYLPGTSGWKGSFGTVPIIPALPWNPRLQPSGATLAGPSSPFGFIVTGSHNLSIVVESCTNLLNAAWQPVQSSIITTGSVSFNDPQWTNYASRFYRLRSP